MTLINDAIGIKALTIDIDHLNVFVRKRRKGDNEREEDRQGRKDEERANLADISERL